MSDKLLGQLVALVDRGRADLAESQAKDQISDLLGFLFSLYGSGRVEDENSDNAIKYATLSLAIKRTPENLSNLVYVLNKAGQRVEAVAVFGDHHDITEPGTASLHYNHAVTLMECGTPFGLRASARAFRKARDLDPSCAMTHYQLSNVLFALGEYREALAEDQYRFEAHSQLRRFRKRFPKPDWDAKTKERVLVFSEQGLGDAIHCARYLKHVRDAGCHVVLEIQKELARLFEGHSWVDEVYPREGNDFVTQVVPDDAYDSVVSINSLPFHFDPELTSPAAVKYLDPHEEPLPVLLLHERPRIGLVWAGSRFHTNDRERSVHLKLLAPLFDVRGVSLLNFQQGEMVRTWCKGASTLWEGDDNYEVVDLAEGAEGLLAKMPKMVEGCRDFYDTALLLKQLDMLITVDTAMAHLAGAMGVPTCLMLPQRHEWRWQRDWYTSVRYFKQESPGDWAGVVGAIASDMTATKNEKNALDSPARGR